MNSRAASELVAIRIQPEHLREIDRAAHMSGLSRSAFLRSAALQAGRRVTAAPAP